jgi:RNA polymerase sigma-70 factor (ECF subfamily)
VTARNDDHPRVCSVVQTRFGEHWVVMRTRDRPRRGFIRYRGGEPAYRPLRLVEIAPHHSVNADAAKKLGLLVPNTAWRSVPVGRWIRRLVQRWDERWTEPQWDGITSVARIEPWAPKRWAAENSIIPDEIRLVLGDPPQAARSRRPCPELLIPIRTARLWRIESEWWPAPEQGCHAIMCFGGGLKTLWHPALRDHARKAKRSAPGQLRDRLHDEPFEFDPFRRLRRGFFALCKDVHLDPDDADSDDEDSNEMGDGDGDTRRREWWCDIKEKRADADDANPEKYFDKAAPNDGDQGKRRGASYFDGRRWTHDGRVEDWVQETLARALKKTDAYELGTSVHAWLQEFRRKVIGEDIRKYGRRGEVPDTYNISDDEEDEVGYAENLACRPNQHGHLEYADYRAALAGLTPEQREALDLIAFGYTCKEAATRCGCSEAAFEKRVNRARAKLASVAPHDVGTDGRCIETADNFSLPSNAYRSPYDRLREVSPSNHRSPLKQGDALEDKRFPELPKIEIARFPKGKRYSQDRCQDRRVLRYLMREFEADVRPAKICPPETITRDLIGPPKRRPFDLGPFFQADLYPGFDLPAPLDAAAEACWAETKAWKRTGGLRPDGGSLVGLSWTGKRRVADFPVAGVSLKAWLRDREELARDMEEHPDYYEKVARGEDVTIGVPEYGPNARPPSPSL